LEMKDNSEQPCKFVATWKCLFKKPPPDEVGMTMEARLICLTCVRARETAAQIKYKKEKLGKD